MVLITMLATCAKENPFGRDANDLDGAAQLPTEPERKCLLGVS